jgi:hypothetical protein
VDLLAATQALQRFFNSARTWEFRVCKSDVENLYRSAAMLAKGKQGHVHYVSSKLGLRLDPADHEDLIQMIHHHIRDGMVFATSGTADNAFRAMLELLNDSDKWVNATDRAIIMNYMTPFAHIVQEASLIERHSSWT